jgi:hypothetical protein
MAFAQSLTMLNIARTAQANLEGDGNIVTTAVAPSALRPRPEMPLPLLSRLIKSMAACTVVMIQLPSLYKMLSEPRWRASTTARTGVTAITGCLPARVYVPGLE